MADTEPAEKQTDVAESITAEPDQEPVTDFSLKQESDVASQANIEACIRTAEANSTPTLDEPKTGDAPDTVQSESLREEEDEEDDLFGGDDDEVDTEPQMRSENPSTSEEIQTETAEANGSSKYDEVAIPRKQRAVRADSESHMNSSISMDEDVTSHKKEDLETHASSQVAEALVPLNGHVPGTPSATNDRVFNSDDFTDGAKYGLPAGVRVPLSITGSLLNQGKLLDTIATLPVNLINDALTEYDDAVQIKGEAIRNHGAYLYGVVKRYVSVHDRAASGEGAGILPMGEGLTPVIHERLEQLVSSNFCTREEMNEKVKSKIRMLSEKDALFALDELSSVERSSIRNFGSYFMGILNRYMRGDASSKIRPPPEATAHDAPHRGRNPLQPPTSFSNQRFDDRRRDDRGRDRFHRDPNKGGPGHPEYPPSASFQRDRSRDRYDGRGNDSFVNNSMNRNRPMDPYRPDYDTRQQHLQQPPPWQQHQQPANMGGVMVQGAPYAIQDRSATNPVLQQLPYSPSQQQQQHQFAQPNQQQGMFLQQPLNQQQFVPQQQQHHHQQTFFSPSNLTPNPHSISQDGFQQSHNMANQQNQFVGAQHQTFVQQQQPAMFNQQTAFVGHPQHINPMPPPSSQDSSRHFTPAPGGWQQQSQIQQQQTQSPLDILGLADKAASAVQALANQKMQMAAASTPSQPYMNYATGYGVPPISGQPIPVAPSFPPTGLPQQTFPPTAGGKPDPSNRRRRTTASIGELPASVQYAVQNLHATGSIDGQLDEGILGMIFDLPEQIALNALHKFAAIDKSTMRNKTAYLAGVLRRELEKIHKR